MNNEEKKFEYNWHDHGDHILTIPNCFDDRLIDYVYLTLRLDWPSFAQKSSSRAARLEQLETLWNAFTIPTHHTRAPCCIFVVLREDLQNVLLNLLEVNHQLHHDVHTTPLLRAKRETQPISAACGACWLEQAPSLNGTHPLVRKGEGLFDQTASSSPSVRFNVYELTIMTRSIGQGSQATGTNAPRAPSYSHCSSARLWD